MLGCLLDVGQAFRFGSFFIFKNSFSLPFQKP